MLTQMQHFQNTLTLTCVYDVSLLSAKGVADPHRARVVEMSAVLAARRGGLRSEQRRPNDQSGRSHGAPRLGSTIWRQKANLAKLRWTPERQVRWLVCARCGPVWERTTGRACLWAVVAATRATLSAAKRSHCSCSSAQRIEITRRAAGEAHCASPLVSATQRGQLSRTC